MLAVKTDYKSQVKTMPTLEVPPDLTSPAKDNRFVVPETGKSSATLSGYQAERKDQARSGNTQVLPQVDQMRVERAGSERWLVVSNDPPEKLWPLVKDFWQENGFLLTTDQRNLGIMETDWAENRAKLPQDIIRGTIGTAVLDQPLDPRRPRIAARVLKTPGSRYPKHRPADPRPARGTAIRAIDTVIAAPATPATCDKPDPALTNALRTRHPAMSHHMICALAILHTHPDQPHPGRELARALGITGRDPLNAFGVALNTAARRGHITKCTPGTYTITTEQALTPPPNP